MKNAILARRYYVSGRVQGVGFRNYVEHVANKLDLGGYVRNRHDGSVEVLAIGTSEQLDRLRAALEKGPMLSDVAQVREEPGSPDQRYIGNFTIELTL